MRISISMNLKEAELIDKALFNIFDMIHNSGDEKRNLQDVLMERFSPSEIEDIEILWRKLSGKRISIEI